MGRLIALGFLLVALQAVTGADQCDATGPRKDCGASSQHALQADHGLGLPCSTALDSRSWIAQYCFVSTFQSRNYFQDNIRHQHRRICLTLSVMTRLSVAGYGGIEQSVCQSKGCCYISAPATTGAALVTLPVCFYPNGGDSSFSLSGGGLQASGRHLNWPLLHLLDPLSPAQMPLC